ncbi:hypothetical protein GH714_004226 [Hevea brasiliensis]|uniref:BHLH domain-containing protein n=1 Tax=Hevea brasiliensis TaxID=3981 RepID=A0A6A6MAS9_HEVBR|nr:hypothetical protein GH714_004226 [Hevea brasiliensis]
MGGNGDNNDGKAFQNGGQSVINCQSSGMSGNPFFASAWDPVVSMSQHENFGGSSMVSHSEFTNSPYPVVMENQGNSTTSHLVHYPSDSSYAELMPKFPSYGSGSFSEMVCSFGLTECSQVANTGCHLNYSSNKEANVERTITNCVESQEDRQLTEEPIIGATPDGKRRKRVAESNSPFDPNKNAEGERQKDPSGHSSEVQKEQDEKKPRTEQNTAANLRGKQAAKQAKDNSHSGEAPNENYIHVRREKISERMRLLQELVPGCNKITGKAVMLDEIINYVQSLQQQVEFLSMKLATVNPELSHDIERILSKDAALDHDLQSLFQMGFDSSSAIDSLGANGRLKPEL